MNDETWILITYPDGAEYFMTDLDELYVRCREAQYVRPLADYNLTDSVDQHRICNFRLTPGTRNLYRSYHPYYPDKPQYDTEIERLYWVAELARQAGIRSDITLSSNKSSKVGEKVATYGDDTIVVSIPDYHQTLIENGDILYVGAATGSVPSAGQCYYHSEDVYFAAWMKEVVEFIIDTIHPMPIQMHCALGADRTGMFCATIAALCGADWQTIMADYQETGNMKIQPLVYELRCRPHAVLSLAAVNIAEAGRAASGKIYLLCPFGHPGGVHISVWKGIQQVWKRSPRPVLKRIVKEKVLPREKMFRDDDRLIPKRKKAKPPRSFTKLKIVTVFSFAIDMAEQFTYLTYFVTLATILA